MPLGVILYQLLTGQLPFQGDSTLEVLRAVTSDEPAYRAAGSSRVPATWRPSRCIAWRRSPRSRYPAAALGAGRGPAAVPDREARDEARPVGGGPADPRVPSPAADRAVARLANGLVVRRPGGSDLEMAGS